jgi:hypothetical protein
VKKSEKQRFYGQNRLLS